MLDNEKGNASLAYFPITPTKQGCAPIGSYLNTPLISKGLYLSGVGSTVSSKT